jgi:hypothetical protein
MCLVIPPEQSGGIFGFTEFVTAFALLVLIYTMSEVQYRFRVATAPLPLWRITYWLSAFIGFGTLITDLWFAERFPTPSFLASRRLWQAGFGLLFFVQVMIWLWYAFVRPPAFGRRNSIRFIQVLYRYILQGSERDVPIIASELVRSAQSIIKHAPVILYIQRQEPRQKRISTFCRHATGRTRNQSLWCDASSSLSVERAAISIFVCVLFTHVSAVLGVAVPTHVFPVIDVGR